MVVSQNNSKRRITLH